MKPNRSTDKKDAPDTVPVYGKDEMNFVEFPLSPITPGKKSIMEIDHTVRDPKTKQPITRRLVVRAAEGLGLPLRFRRHRERKSEFLPKRVVNNGMKGVAESVANGDRITESP